MLVIRERYSSVWNSCDSKEERFAIVQFQFSLYFDFKLWTDFTCFRFWHSFRFMNNVLCSTFWGVVAKKKFYIFFSLSSVLSQSIFAIFFCFNIETSFRLSHRISRRTNILIKVRKYYFFKLCFKDCFYLLLTVFYWEC